MPTRKSKKNGRYRGGKFIGEGTYGCGFSPALKCNGEPRKAGPYLSKMITDKYEAIIEFTISQKIKKVDPTRKYFLTADSICEHDQTDITVSNEPEKCKKFPLEGPTYLISYEMGGDNLSKLKIPANLYPKFFVGLIGLIEGLMTLHLNEMVHLDIKPDNIVGKYYDDHYKIRYIDFGLSRETATLNANSEHVKMLRDFNLEKVYPYYPFDMLMTSLNRQQTPIVAQTEIGHWYRMTDINMAKNNYKLPQDSYWSSERLPKYNGKNLSTEYTKTAKWYANLSNHLKSVDMFSLGVSLCSIYARITGHIRVYDSKTRLATISILAGGKVYSKEDLRLKFTEDVYSFHRNLSAVSMTFYNEMNKLLLPFGNLRPTAEDLYVTLEPILRTMDSVFGDSALTYKALKAVGVNVELDSITPPKSYFTGVSELSDPTNPTESLPPGWEKQINSDGRSYYVELSTGKIQWAKPPMRLPGNPPPRKVNMSKSIQELVSRYGKPAVPEVPAAVNPMRNQTKLNYRRLMPDLYPNKIQTNPPIAKNPMYPRSRARTRKNRRSN